MATPPISTPFGLRLHHADVKRMKKLAKQMGITQSMAAQRCCKIGLDEMEGLASAMSNPVMAMCFQLASVMTNEPDKHEEFAQILASVKEYKSDMANKQRGQGLLQPPEFAT